MEDQKKKPSVASRLWSNWVNLDPQQRNAVAQNLGPMGQVLTIAANVHQFVNNTQHDVDPNQSRQGSTNYSHSNRPDIDDDPDIIDAEFVEEVDP